jgi:hypothetical protein
LTGGESRRESSLRDAPSSWRPCQMLTAGGTLTRQADSGSWARSKWFPRSSRTRAAPRRKYILSAVLNILNPPSCCCHSCSGDALDRIPAIVFSVRTTLLTPGGWSYVPGRARTIPSACQPPRTSGALLSRRCRRDCSSAWSFEGCCAPVSSAA